jgi:hypothetical protein
MMEADSDPELIALIAPDVMSCLTRSGFFEKLDDCLCPTDITHSPKICDGDYKLSELILQDRGFDSPDLADIFNVLKSKGGFCDCEILYNVAESSRLKTEYWRNRTKTARGIHVSTSSNGVS